MKEDVSKFAVGERVRVKETDEEGVVTHVWDTHPFFGDLVVEIACEKQIFSVEKVEKI